MPVDLANKKMGQSFNSSDISSAISDVHRAQRHFDGFDGVAMRLMRGEHQSRRNSFEINIDGGATSETAASTSSSIYSEDIYNDNTFESCLVGEMLSVALDQDMFVEDAVLPQEYCAAAVVEPSTITKTKIPALLIVWTMACIASGALLGVGVSSVFRTRWVIATVPVWAIGVLPFIGRVAHQFHLSQRPGH